MSWGNKERMAAFKECIVGRKQALEQGLERKGAVVFTPRGNYSRQEASGRVVELEAVLLSFPDWLEDDGSYVKL